MAINSIGYKYQSQNNFHICYWKKQQKKNVREILRNVKIFAVAWSQWTSTFFSSLIITFQLQPFSIQISNIFKPFASDANQLTDEFTLKLFRCPKQTLLSSLASSTSLYMHWQETSTIILIIKWNSFTHTIRFSKYSLIRFFRLVWFLFF